jgi:DNA-binding NtrC family response regulator
MANRGDLELGARPQIILIVEDDALVRLDAAEFLRDGGHGVHEAANASEAMDLLRSEFTVDLLFTDINLGKGLNGTSPVDSGKFAAPKDPGHYRRDCVSSGSRNDI